MSNYWVKRKVLGVLLVSLIMIAGMVFISQRAYADIVYDKWVEWGDVEDTVPRKTAPTSLTISATERYISPLMLSIPIPTAVWFRSITVLWSISLLK